MYKMKGGKRCIVFDLDECLIHSMEMKYANYEAIYLTDPKYASLLGRLFSVILTDVNTPEGTGVTERHWGLKRPHLNRLLKYSFDNFDYVCVWSAGHRKYVIEIVNQIFDGIGVPHLVFTRDNIRNPEGMYDKPLSWMLEHPLLKGRVTLENTVLIDDRVHNFISSPKNGILIPRYDPAPTEVLYDEVSLLQLEQYFRSAEFQNARDVRTLDTSQIFKTRLNLPPLPSDVAPIILATEVTPVKKESKLPTYIASSIVVPGFGSSPFSYSMPALLYV